MEVNRPISWKKIIKRCLGIVVCFLMLVFMLPGAQIQLLDMQDRVQPFTRDVQFNYVRWTLKAVTEKFSAASMGWQQYIPSSEYASILQQYLVILAELDEAEQQLNVYYSQPAEDKNPEELTEIQKRYVHLKKQQSLIEPVYESLLTEQIRRVLKENDLTVGNQPFPPVLFRKTDLPYALILSPRDHIEQIANISLLPDLPLTELVELEKNIEAQMNVSALVVPVGGIGTYPTMIMRTTNFPYTVEVIQHEWIHNYLTLFPLGLNYETTPELRTINETTASIAGKELGNYFLAKYYPHLLPEPPVTQEDPPTISQSAPPPFDFRAEMRLTRMRVDKLLLEGEIAEAEQYMENRRLYFLDNGYTLRRINQAYFAFYGAYADQPGGAAGDDPVGEAVRTLRNQKNTLAVFLKTIAWVDDYDQLLSLLQP
jgi:signal recognition particle subunit SEC65